MKIEAPEFILKLTNGELFDLAFNVQTSLEHTIKTHWVNHQDRWRENEASRLCLLKDMFYALGRPDLYDSAINKAEQLIKEFNQKNPQ